jgi:hypothetical protein
MIARRPMPIYLTTYVCLRALTAPVMRDGTISATAG